MGDMGEYWRAGREVQQERKESRREKNMKWLEASGIAWNWIDECCDHILINGVVDYYLGKTYWFNRKTKKSGYTMLYKLRV